MARTWLMAAGVSGFLSVALGAFGAHGLRGMLDDYGRGLYETAVLYQMFHTLALFAVGVLQVCWPKSNFKLTGWCFIIGMVLFCGSLYLLSVTGLKWLGAVTPAGGVAFLTGWGGLLYTTARSRALS